MTGERSCPQTAKDPARGARSERRESRPGPREALTRKRLLFLNLVSGTCPMEISPTPVSTAIDQTGSSRMRPLLAHERKEERRRAARVPPIVLRRKEM